MIDHFENITDKSPVSDVQVLSVDKLDLEKGFTIVYRDDCGVLCQTTGKLKHIGLAEMWFSCGRDTLLLMIEDRAA